MSNPIEEIGNSKGKSADVENIAKVQKLRELHALYREVAKYAEPLIDQFAAAIGEDTSSAYVIKDEELPQKIRSLPPTDQIKLLTKEEPLWVITNQKSYIDPDISPGDWTRLILIRWKGTTIHDGEFSVTYNYGKKEKTRWNENNPLGMSLYWPDDVPFENAEGTETELKNMLRDLYNYVQGDSNHPPGKQ